MDYIPVPNTVQLELIQSWQGQVVENVLHYVKASPWNSDQMTELAEEAKEQFNATILTQLTSTLQLTMIRVTDLSSQTGSVVNYGTGLPAAGPQGSPSLPNNVAVVFTKRTELRGRSFRGRIYQPGLVEGAVVANSVTNPTLQNLRNGWDGMRLLTLTIAVDEALMVVVSRYADKAPRVTGVATLVSAITTDGVIDSQRRRLPGRGS